jgi:hypothetical protein
LGLDFGRVTLLKRCSPCYTDIGDSSIDINDAFPQKVGIFV